MKVAFYKGKDRFFNKVVSWWMRGKYSHCEMVVKETSEGSVCYSSSETDGGVRKKIIKLDPNHWDVLEIDVDPTKVEDWFESRLGQKYDYIGLVGFLFRRVAADKDRWFCSESCAASLGIEEPWRYDPVLLYLLLKYKFHTK